MFILKIMYLFQVLFKNNGKEKEYELKNLSQKQA